MESQVLHRLIGLNADTVSELDILHGTVSRQQHNRGSSTERHQQSSAMIRAWQVVKIAEIAEDLQDQAVAVPRMVHQVM